MSLLNSLIPIATDTEGRTIPNAKLYSYDVGTSTPKATYSDPGLSIENANPLESDGAGRFFNVYLGAGGYKLEIRDSNNVVWWTQDDYYQALDGSDLTNIDADIAAVSQQLSQTYFIGLDVGVADAYELDAVGAQLNPTDYAPGMVIGFSPVNANTGASTVNVIGLPTKNLVMPDGSPLAANFLTPGSIYQFYYFLGLFVFFFKSGLIVEEQIDDAAVTRAKIEDGAINADKLADEAVTLAKMADGTPYKLVGYGSDNAATSFTNPMRLLSSGSPTAAALLQFVLSTLDSAQSTDNCYLVRFMGIQPATDDLIFYLTLSDDAGSTYAATLYDSVCTGNDTGNTNRFTNVASGTQIELAGSGVALKSLSNAAGETCSMDIIFYNVNTGTSIVPTINWSVSYYNADGALTRQSGGASRAAASDYDAIKFTWEGGANFAAVGRYYLYKLANVI